ncbi:MAG: hypothetical protein KA733_00500 [Thauera sp.]|nr:hypothetical protein [Thauera sp.]MBP7639238.1 hypothetical protein [Thauera sp.]
MSAPLARLGQRLRARWMALPAAERKRALLVGGLLVFSLFAGVHAFVTQPALTKLGTELNRARGRAQENAKAVPAPAGRTPLRSPHALQADLDALDEALRTARSRRDRVRARFVDVADLAGHQALRLGVSSLANDSDIEVAAIETVGVRREEQRLAPTVERLLEMARANPYGRPLMRLRARASYRGLMDFLDGLAELPHVAAPVRIAIEVRTDATPDAPASRQWLEIDLELAL